MVKLSKGETNELLQKISEDNQTYGLIFKLIYVYGKDARSILTLKWSEVNLKKDNIRFKNEFFPLLPMLKKDFESLTYSGTYVFLEDDNDNLDNRVDIYRKKLRYYLNDKIKQLDLPLRVKHVGLSITDLRRLRGQHLLIDGVDLSIIKKLYLQKEGTTTQFKKYLCFDDLNRLKYPCDDMEVLFRDYTDLCIFDLHEYDDGDLQLVVTDHEDFETLVSIDDGVLVFMDSSVPKEYVDKISEIYNGGLLGNLGVLKSSEFKLVDGLSFIRL